jgi:hypothetical protein
MRNIRGAIQEIERKVDTLRTMRDRNDLVPGPAVRRMNTKKLREAEVCLADALTREQSLVTEYISGGQL